MSKSHNARFFRALPWPSHFVGRSNGRCCGWSSQRPIFGAGRGDGRTGRPGQMTSIDKYIFRTTFGAFALTAVSLTLLIWVTQALREIDLMTNQRQAVLAFIGMTGLLIPVLVLLIAPIALMIAVTYTLNKLNADS